SAAAIFDASAGGEVFAEAQDGAMEVAIGRGAARVGGDLVRISAAGEVAGVQYIFGAGGIGVAVVSALVDAAQIIILRLNHVLQPGDSRTVIWAAHGGVDA